MRYHEGCGYSTTQRTISFKSRRYDSVPTKALAITWCLAAAAMTSGLAPAAEPNEAFATSTLIAPSVLFVADQLTPGQFQRPDTLLGIRNGAGAITQVDDNGSIVGNGFASGLTNVPTNANAVSFLVTGAGDAAFSGNHAQAGQYEVIVDVFNALGDPLGSVSDFASLAPGVVNAFSFVGPSQWVGGRYNVNIDNSIATAVGGDVDFFTFTGLTPGAAFIAETFDPSSNINTFLYWINSAGAAIDIDDNSGVGNFSLIDGMVPANGRLTLAVTGFGDLVSGLPAGEHTQNGTYQLRVILPGLLSADFNGSGAVDGADLALWKGAFGKTIAADADRDYDSDGADFLAWQRQRGAASSAGAVPEPPSSMLLPSALVAAAACRRSTRGTMARR